MTVKLFDGCILGQPARIPALGAESLASRRKRSFGSQSERGERFAERVMTAVRTARKQGKDVLDFIVASITAHVDGTTAPRLLGANAAA